MYVVTFHPWAGFEEVGLLADLILTVTIFYEEGGLKSQPAEGIELSRNACETRTELPVMLIAHVGFEFVL